MMSPCTACLNAGQGTFSHMGLFISLASIREEESQSPESLRGIRTPGVLSLLRCGSLTFARPKEEGPWRRRRPPGNRLIPASPHPPV